MKIIFIQTIINTYGGLEKVFDVFLNKIKKLDHDFIFIVTDYNDVINDKSKWVKPYTKYEDKILFWVNDKDVEKLTTEFNPDFIICTNFLDFPKIIRNDVLYNKKIIYWDHGMTASNIFGNLLPISDLEFADLFLSISTGIHEKILTIFPSAKSYLIYNPINPYYGNLIKRSKKPIFLYVGRLEDNHKNITFLLKGFSHLIDKDWQLKIIGTGPSEVQLKELAKEFKISSRIEWSGFKSNPFDDINEATALLLTSRFEGFGMVLIEANQRGIPVISSNCNFGPSDIVINGKNGYLFEEGNMQEFVELLNLAIDGKLHFDSPEEISKTTNRFDADIVVNNFVNILENFKKNVSVKQKLIPNYKTKIYDFYQKNSEFIIFGAGSFGKKVKDMLYQKNKKVVYFVDNDINKKGNKLDGIEIKHPSEIKQFEYKIIIASTWKKDIVKQLENNYGLKYFLDYI